MLNSQVNYPMTKESVKQNERLTLLFISKFQNYDYHSKKNFCRMVVLLVVIMNKKTLRSEIENRWQKYIAATFFLNNVFLDFFFSNKVFEQ
jgi:hypothetical protein